MWRFHKAEAAALVGVVAWCVASALLGGTFTVKDGVRDWTLPASYEEGIVPSAADDVIQIPEGVTAYLDLTTDAERASLALVNTVRGFAFAESGTLDVKNLSGNSAVLPVTVEGASASNVAKWTLRVNGEVTTKMRVSLNESNRLTIFPVGMAIIIR